MLQGQAHPYTAAVQAYRPLAELLPTHWQSGFVEAEDGARLHYTRTGDDKPGLVLLHGVQVSGLTWLRTAQALEAEYDVVMPDFRGHGESARVGTAQLSADLLVRDTQAVMQAVGMQKPFVVGHSMGADIAGRLAAVTHTHPLRGVVLVDPALRNFAAAMMPADGTTPPWMQALFDTMRSLKTLPHAQRMAAGLRMLLPGVPLWNEADYVSFVEGQAQFDLDFFRYAVQMGYLVEAPDVIAQIACPALLLTARPMMPGIDIQPGVEMFMGHLAHGQHIHFDDSGHTIMFDQFERFVDVLRGFFAGK
jgi:pimeloyl-ACP methyl ester carboxylesterase